MSEGALLAAQRSRPGGLSWVLPTSIVEESHEKSLTQLAGQRPDARIRVRAEQIAAGCAAGGFAADRVEARLRRFVVRGVYGSDRWDADAGLRDLGGEL